MTTTFRLYLEDASQLSLTATVREVEAVPDADPAQFRVRLDRTVFHPQGGGQKADRGTIGGVDVLKVSNAADGDVDHFLAAALEVGAQVELQVDPAWRLFNARYHTAGHLIAALVEARQPACKAISGHHWPGEARVEFSIEGDAAAISANDVQAQLAPDMVEALAADLPVKVVGDPHTARAVQIAEHAAVPCGGTHVPGVSALREVEVKNVRVKGGKLRVSYAVSE